MMQFLKRLNPAAKHHSRTWRTYAKRMELWLTISGYLKQLGDEWVYDDVSEIREDYIPNFDKATKRRRVVFIGDAPPGRVVEALEYIKQQGPQGVSKMKSLGYRNACAVLYRFGLLELTANHEYRLLDPHYGAVSSLQAVWTKSNDEETLREVLDFLRTKPSASGVAVGQAVAQAYNRSWTPATLRRSGNSLRQWASWLLQGTHGRVIPTPPGQSPPEDAEDEPTFL